MNHSFVRPRFTDGTFDEPLPLEEHFAEQFLGGLVPRQLLLEGARGSGLSTALEVLAYRAREGGREALFADSLFHLTPQTALAKLADPRAVLFADLSVTPLGRHDLDLLRALGPAFLRSHAFVACGTRLGPLLRWSGIGEESRVCLTPWGKDELIELLGTEDYVAHRARLHASLARLAEGHRLLSRPRTARWIVDAASRLEEGEPVTRSRVFANVLDELSPATISLVKRSARLEASPTGEPWDLEEVLTVYDVDPRAARAIVQNRKPRSLPPALALEGLHDFLRAGAIVKAIAADEVRALPDRAALPFVAEMMTTALEERLREWLTTFEPKPHRDAIAATILHARGQRLPEMLAGRDFSGALLVGADLRGAKLLATRFRTADLAGARFDGANLRKASFVDAEAPQASFEGADLEGAEMQQTRLQGASLRGAKLEGAHFRGAALQGASFEEALLAKATFTDSSLERADFTGAVLHPIAFSNVELAEADFTGADMADAVIHRVDLRETRLAPTSLAGAKIEHCRLSELDLGGLVASKARFWSCELSSTVLRGAKLDGAEFYVRAHEAVFDDADLRGAVFASCNFHAGSSRAGLLLGKPALEGNMTGYYLEGTTDDAWTSPDAIAVASFKGADLRGARFPNTDLFRVDFRGAFLDPGLRADAAKQGAILD